MREYVYRWQGQRGGLKTSELSTREIKLMLEYIAQGRPATYGEGETREAVIEQLRLELQIRAWGMR